MVLIFSSNPHQESKTTFPFQSSEMDLWVSEVTQYFVKKLFYKYINAFTSRLVWPFRVFQFDPKQNYRCQTSPRPLSGPKSQTFFWQKDQKKKLSGSIWTMVRFVSSVKTFLDGSDIRINYKKLQQGIVITEKRKNELRQHMGRGREQVLNWHVVWRRYRKYGVGAGICLVLGDAAL